jgi:acylphosphatase
MPMTTRSVHIRITGRVQGVGYRAWLEGEAVARELSGWVRNRHDGSVEALVSGDAEEVGNFIARLSEGPPAARVSDVTVAEHDGIIGPGFDVLPTE